MADPRLQQQEDARRRQEFMDMARAMYRELQFLRSQPSAFPGWAADQLNLPVHLLGVGTTHPEEQVYEDPAEPRTLDAGGMVIELDPDPEDPKTISSSPSSGWGTDYPFEDQPQHQVQHPGLVRGR
jgi:hypothetical protein